ncbi:hypothetical protein [Paenibacillus sp. FSL F4-0097]|uniref:hypothetical protein n=1 Tax=Paenibacillus sp. FSL F4-0097 TaxID=2921369 RepID=UPI00315899DA
MPIEIKILSKRSSGDAPAGNYIARYLNDKNRTIQSLNPCRSVQIIEGIHSGQIVPYESYVVIGDLPAQADVLRQNVKMIEGLAEAARTIQEQDKVINRVKEENEKLRNGEYEVNYAPRYIGALKERIQQLEWELGSWRNSKKVQLPREVAAELDELIIKGISYAAIASRFFTAADEDEERYGVSELLEWTEHGRTEPGKVRVMIFLSALVNGYVEEPEPQKDVPSNIRSEVTEIIKCWMGTPPVADEGNDAERLTDWIFDHFQQHGDDKLPF